VSPHEAVERTLLFACERIHRHDVQIRPMLNDGTTVLTPFFTMAPAVYQEMEGLGDRRIIDIMLGTLTQPDRVIVVYSDPKIAARRATQSTPGAGQFYSPYRRVEEFERALKLHDKAIQEFTSRGIEVRVLEVDSGVVSEAVESEGETLVLAPIT